MFEKTGFLFRFLYFITAISPAVLLFSLSMKVNAIYLLVEIIIIFFSLLMLKYILNNSYQNGGITEFIKNEAIADKNGEVLSFIFGIIIPSVIIPDSVGNITKIFIFICVQILVFTVMIKSSSVFPNLLLIIFGVNTYKLDSGKYLIDLNGIIVHNKLNLETKRLGSSTMSNTYLVGREKE